MITSVVLNCAGRPFISQTIAGVGAPIEVQESLSDPPSSTDNTRAWLALVEALTVIYYALVNVVNYMIPHYPPSPEADKGL